MAPTSACSRSADADVQADHAARAPPARLHAGAPVPDDDDVLAELLEHSLIAALKALAHRREHDDGDDAPHDAEHREAASQLVGAKVVDGLCQRLLHDGNTTRSP
jgi:hypothetical protein